MKILPGGQRVGPGDPLKIGAQTMNTLLDVVADFRSRQLPSGVAGLAGVNAQPSLSVRIFNGTTTSYNAGDVVSYRNSQQSIILDNQPSIDQAAADPIVLLEPASTIANNLGILAGALPPSSYGRAIVSGFAIATLRRTVTNPQGAGVDPTNRKQLTTGTGGIFSVVNVNHAVNAIGPALVYLSPVPPPVEIGPIGPPTNLSANFSGTWTANFSGSPSALSSYLKLTSSEIKIGAAGWWDIEYLVETNRMSSSPANANYNILCALIGSASITLPGSGGLLLGNTSAPLSTHTRAFRFRVNTSGPTTFAVHLLGSGSSAPGLTINWDGYGFGRATSSFRLPQST
jgi:hypothetical protein